MQLKQKSELRVELRTACAIAGYDLDGPLSLNQLVTLVLENGLPSKAERERIRQLALEAQEDDTTES